MIMDAARSRDGFAGVFLEHRYEVVKRLQGLGHPCAWHWAVVLTMLLLSRADVGIAIKGATDIVRGLLTLSLLKPVFQPLCTPFVVLVSSSNV
ncbi:hypothetical protein FB446DRAFT_69472 [Lentinula raphanica]|nr:hypothetical protein FB446DRAFT_69472 [Lentinula raphanica]